MQIHPNFEKPMDVNVKDFDDFPEGWVQAPIEPTEVYPMEDILHAWAKNEHFNLFKSKSDQGRVYFVCNYSSYKPLKPDRNAKRQSSSHKTGCPFILRITYKNSRSYWSLNDPLSDTERTHNHPCTAAYNSISPLGKKALTTQEDIKTIASMANNNSNVTEIMKNITKFQGNPVLNYQDVANMNYK